MPTIRTYHRDPDPNMAMQSRLRGYWSMVADYKAALELYESLYPSCTSQPREATIMCSGGNGQEERVTSFLDHRERLRRSLLDKLDDIQFLEALVESLPNDERVVIKRYYMSRPRMRIEDIAKALIVSERHCWRLHRRGLDMMVKKVGTV